MKGARTLADEIRSGSSYDSNNDMRIHSLGSHENRLDPDSLAERAYGAPENNISVDAIHNLKEGSGTEVKQPAKTS